MISSRTRLCRRPAAARTSWRSARAILPCLPITLPTSSFATNSLSTTTSSRSSRSTLTASGWSTSRRASTSSSSANVLDLEQAPHRLRRLRALVQPRLHLLLVQLDRRGVGLRVVPPDDLDELAVARRARIGRDDAVDRVLLRPDARQPQFHCQAISSLSSCVCSSSCALPKLLDAPVPAAAFHSAAGPGPAACPYPSAS